MTLDAAYLRGSMAAISFILQHTSCPEHVAFHFVAMLAANKTSLSATVSSSFLYLNFRIYPFDASTVSHLISTSIRSALDSPLDYTRSYLTILLSACVRRAIYLDSDLILVDDIRKLYATDLCPTLVLATPDYYYVNFTSYFTPSFWSNPSLSLTFADYRACYFNTGVMVIDLARWRISDYTRQIEELMELQKRMRIYKLGSLLPFLFIFVKRIIPVDHRWK